MSKKYKLTSESVLGDWRKLYRIKALRSFGSVRKGDLGGYVESEANLSHDGNCWVYGDARVVGDARISGEATVSRDATVYGNATVFGEATVSENARVYGNARIFGDATIFGAARVYGNARVFGDAAVYSQTEVYGNSQVYGHARIFGSAYVYGNARVFGSAYIYGDAQIYDIYIDSNKQYVNILASPHSITITYAYVRIGCMHFDLDDLLLDDYRSLVAARELEAYDIARTKLMIDVCLDGILEAMSKGEV